MNSKLLSIFLFSAGWCIHIIQMSCITEATGGAGSYTIVEFFSYDATVATIVVVVACCLLPVTLYLGQKQRRLLKSTPVLSAGAAQVKEWYSTLSLFPSIAAVGCWLSICLPNLGIVFELCYEVTFSFLFLWGKGVDTKFYVIHDISIQKSILLINSSAFFIIANNEQLFEAICLTRFAFILLVLINGGVRVCV
jgi:hypothetical protein